MCIIIASWANSPIVERDTIDICADNNNDGFGLMYPEGGRVKIWKTMTDTTQLYDRFLEVRQRGLPAILHFRWATHGNKTIDNVHPFHVPGTNRQLGFVHNGVLSVPSSKEVSDTRVFGKHVLAALKQDWRDDEMLRACLEEGFLGTGNKVVTLDHDGRIDILNEDQGVYDDQVWYSNKGYLWNTRYTGWTKQYGYTKTGGSTTVNKPRSANHKDDDIVGYSFHSWIFCVECVDKFGSIDEDIVPIHRGEVVKEEICEQCDVVLAGLDGVAPDEEVPDAPGQPYDEEVDPIGDRLFLLSGTDANPSTKFKGESQLQYLVRRRELYLEIATATEQTDPGVSYRALKNFNGMSIAAYKEHEPTISWDLSVLPLISETVANYIERRVSVLDSRRTEADRRALAKVIQGTDYKAGRWNECPHGVALKEYCATCKSVKYAEDAAADPYSRFLELTEEVVETVAAN